MNEVTLEMRDSVAVVRLQRGVSNAINLALVTELRNLLSQAAQDPQIHGLVLTSSNSKFFSIGFDLPALVDQILPAEDLETAAVEKIRGIGALSPQAFALIKRNRVEPVVDRITQVLGEKEKNFMESWFSPEARNLLAEARKNF